MCVTVSLCVEHHSPSLALLLLLLFSSFVFYSALDTYIDMTHAPVMRQMRTVCECQLIEWKR